MDFWLTDRLRKRRPVYNVYPTSFLIKGISRDITKRSPLTTIVLSPIGLPPLDDKLSQLTDKVGVLPFVPLSIQTIYQFCPFGCLMLFYQVRQACPGTRLYKKHLLIFHG